MTGVMGAVIDASVAVKLVVTEPDSDSAERVVGDLTASGVWIGAPELAAWGHLKGQVHWFQMATQVILTLITLAFLAAVALFMAAGWRGVIFKDQSQPPKSLFPDVMPVGSEIPFTTMPKPEPQEEPEPESPAEPAAS